MSAAAMEAPPKPAVKAKTNLELVQARYEQRYGCIRTITPIAVDGGKEFFRVNFFNEQDQKFTSYWVSVSDGLIKDESR